MRPFFAALCGLCVALLSGCVQGAFLAPPPNLYLEGRNYQAEAVPGVLQTATPTIFFVTDRARDGAGYGAKRSDAMVFGAADVSFGTGLSWQEVVARTHTDSGRRLSRLEVRDTQALVQFSGTPLPYERADGVLRTVAQAREVYQQETRAFQDAIAEQIRQTGNTRVLVYVHGFNTGFDDTLTTLANLWHFAGRRTVPVAFSWPAGSGIGPIGYFSDRESGTFAVHHAKEFLRMIAAIPEVEDIDIVAHSRGTDVMTQALREMIIFERGRGVHPKLGMKTGTLILAAPDLDTGIVRQRLVAERFSEAFEQVNAYINPRDAALRLSSILTKSDRFGALRAEDVKPGEIARLKKHGLVHFIRVEGRVGGTFGHSYFRDNPAVLSDIVLALRTRAFPGGTLRPLEEGADGIWQLHPNYPLERLPDLLLFESPR
ncbi:MAG: alpha/beta hydrolase [Pseudomonadota bacterium]